MLFGKWQRMFIYIEIQYGNIEIRVEASDAVGSSYGIVILIVKLSRQNGWEQKNHPSKMLILQEKEENGDHKGISIWKHTPN